MKRKWYDYLWLASLAYLILGFFNILFAWLGLLCFFYSAAYFGGPGYEGILQPLLRQRTAVWSFGRALRSFQKEGHSRMDEKQVVPVWIPDILFCHVLFDAVEYVSGIFRRAGLKAGSHAAVDL